MINKSELPKFPYHRDPVESGSVRKSDSKCECCGKARGVMYQGVMYCKSSPENICPWCIADGSASEKYEAAFFDADFVDDKLNNITVQQNYYHEVFCKTIGFSTFNPIGWWVHCNKPAEYVTRNEPYDMVFECTVCSARHIIEDLD